MPSFPRSGPAVFFPEHVLSSIQNLHFWVRVRVRGYDRWKQTEANTRVCVCVCIMASSVLVSWILPLHLRCCLLLIAPLILESEFSFH